MTCAPSESVLCEVAAVVLARSTCAPIAVKTGDREPRSRRSRLCARTMGSSERVLRRLACPISSAGGQWWRTLHGWSGSGCNAGAQEAATSSHADGTSTSSTDGGSAHQLLACSQQPPCDERGWAWQQRLANLTWQPREDHPGAPGAAATGQKPHASSALPLRSLSHAWRRHRARLPTWPPDAQHPSSAALLRHASTSAANAPSPPHQPPLPAWLAALPAAWVPYAQLMRLDRPIGTWLLLWPCLWCASLAPRCHSGTGARHPTAADVG